MEKALKDTRIKVEFHTKGRFGTVEVMFEESELWLLVQP